MTTYNEIDWNKQTCVQTDYRSLLLSAKRLVFIKKHQKQPEKRPRNDISLRRGRPGKLKLTWKNAPLPELTARYRSRVLVDCAP